MRHASIQTTMNVAAGPTTEGKRQPHDKVQMVLEVGEPGLSGLKRLLVNFFGFLVAGEGFEPSTFGL